MVENIFCSEEISFTERIKKDVKIKIFVFLLFFSMILFGLKNNEVGIVHIGFAIYFFLCLATLTLIDSINYIYEVKIDSNNITIFGEKFNKKWEVVLDLQKVNIRIIERRSKTGTIMGYLIDLKTSKKKYRINRLFNWSNYELYKLIITFKNIKGERIIYDEKCYIDGIEKRAREYSEWEKH